MFARKINISDLAPPVVQKKTRKKKPKVKEETEEECQSQVCLCINTSQKINYTYCPHNVCEYVLMKFKSTLCLYISEMYKDR